MKIEDMSSTSSHDMIAKYSAPSLPPNPHEQALQSLCKQILKARLFRGYYTERRYVESLNGYRDIVVLHRSERELEKLLLDIMFKLQLFYQQVPFIWIGLTNGPRDGMSVQDGALSSFLWTELTNTAFGQYWFVIKTIRFRSNEVLLRLKTVRPVELEVEGTSRPRYSASLARMSDVATLTSGGNHTTGDIAQVGLHDFVEVVQNWGRSIKQTVYDFMANDVSKDNIKGILQFLGLLVFTILSGALAAAKFLGIFTIRLIFELSRLTHVWTPIILKIIDVITKIIGGFYILLTMIWKDLVGNRKQANTRRDYNVPVEYNRPMYKSIQYSVRNNNSNQASDHSPTPGFGKKF